MSARLLRGTVCGIFFLLNACGGGGDGASPSPPPPPSPATLTVSLQTISVSAGTDDTAPTATIHAAISNPEGSYYFSSGTGTHGIASVRNPGSGTTGDFTIQFKSPASLGVGTYNDTVNIQACTDSACKDPIGGSPVAVQVTYVVEIKPEIASLGPNAVDAGGTPFQMVVTGTHFDSTSVVQVNGAARETLFISGTSLIANVLAEDIAVAGGVQITVVNNEESGAIASSLTNYADSSVSAGSFIVDTSLSRAYAITSDTAYESATGQTIEGFNLTTLQPTWIARFPSIRSRIVRWGTNGLAFFDGNPLNPSVIFISGTVVAR